MYFVKSLALLAVGVGLVTVVETASTPKQPVREITGLTLTPVSDAALTAPLRNTHGKVKSVVGHRLTLDVGGRDVAFVVDENTDVLPLSRLVRSREMASVLYREREGARRVSAIHVRGRNIIASR